MPPIPEAGIPRGSATSVKMMDLRTGARMLALAMAGMLLLSACGGAQSRRNGGASTRTEPGAPGAGSTPSPLVNPADLLPGGPPPDGIPPIDHPRFLRVADVKFLTPQEPVLAVEVHGQAKAYPLRILIWHEIVNDVVGGDPLAVTYCPLCNTGIAWRRPMMNGKTLTFGTSGKLYHSNLVMYDRQTNSFWPQVLGEAVVGPLTGTKLDFVATQILSWQDWRSEHPDGLVLSQQTGFARDYGVNPYGGYDSSGFPFLFDGKPDSRLRPLARVLGIAAGGDLVAFPYLTLEDLAIDGRAAVNAAVGGHPVVVLWQDGTVSAVDDQQIPESRDVGAVGGFGRRLGGRTLTFTATASGFVDDQTGSLWSISGRAVSGPLSGKVLPPVVAIDSFWFDWVSFHPNTRIYGGETP
jgi:hypothetical protein